MSERLDVYIIGHDGASRALKEVSTSAKQAGADVEAAGRKSAAGMKQAEQATDQTKRSIDEVAKSSERAGVSFDQFAAGLLVVGSALAYAGNAAINQQQTIVGLQGAYGDAADEMIRFADELSKVTIFNDDDILRGERYFATLRTNYDVSIEQIQQLKRTTADLASAASISFEDAANRVTSAIRGEAEAAEYLGLTMNQQSIDRDNLTLKMTNQEAAQFRINALYEQAAWSQGIAIDMVNSDVGARARLTNAIQDNAQALGRFIGPYTAIISGAASGAVGLAQFAGGFTAMASGIRVATTAAAAFAATPLGLAVTAVGGALALATGAFLNHRREADATARAWAEAETAAAGLTDQIDRMTLAGDVFNARFARGLQTALFGEDGEGGQVGWYASQLQALKDALIDTGSWPDTEFADSVVKQMEQAGLDMGPAGAEARAAFFENLMPTAEDEVRLNEALSSLFDLFSNPNIDAGQLQREMQAIYDAWDRAPDGSVTIRDLAESYEALEGRMIRSVEVAALFASTMKRVETNAGLAVIAMEDGTLALVEQAAAVNALSEAEQKRAEQAQAEADKRRQEQEQAASTAEQQWEKDRAENEKTREAERQAAEERAKAVAANKAAFREAIEEERQLREALHDSIMSKYREQEEAAREASRAAAEQFAGVFGLDDPLTGWNLAGLGSEFSALAQAALAAGASIDTVFRTIVGNTNAVKSQVEGVLSWAEGLIDERGTASRLDELVRMGLITGRSGEFDVDTQYAAAQDAYDSIAASTERVRDNLDAVQAIQAPLLAEMVEQTANWTEELLKQPAAQQLITLGWMDAATASKAMEINMLAASAAAGDLGVNGEASVTKMIEGAVRADPILKALLVDMGLISEGADGTITVNFGDAVAADEAMVKLTNAIEDLTRVILGLPPIHLTVDDDASGRLDLVKEKLRQLNGSRATVYVNTVGAPPPTGMIGPTWQHGGMVSRAHGGTIPAHLHAGEIAHFAGGGVAGIPRDGIYGVPAGTYIEPPNSARGKLGGVTINAPLTINAPIYGVDDLNAWWTGEALPSLADELNRHRVAAGVM